MVLELNSDKERPKMPTLARAQTNATKWLTSKVSDFHSLERDDRIAHFIILLRLLAP